MTKKKAPFHVGQVVLINVSFYTSKKSDRFSQRYQMITGVGPWTVPDAPGWALTFSNGDECHSKNVRKLTIQERGGL